MRLSIQSAVQPETFTLRNSVSRLALMTGLVVTISATLAVDAMATEATKSENPAAGEQVVRTPALLIQAAPDGTDYNVSATSSPKQTAPLLDTPQTINVIPQEVIREQGARNLTEVLKNTPGISFNAGENGFATSTNNFSLRGFDASGSIFIDGSRDSGSYSRDIFNIEQVEVVKGAAADNGRGGAGGYVNMVTKTPHFEDFITGEASLGFDEYNSEARKRGTIDVNQTMDKNSAIRINALFEDSGVAGRETAEKKSWGFAPSVAFGLGTDIRATLAYEHIEMNDRPDWGVPGATRSDMQTYNPLTTGASRDNFYGLLSDFDDTSADTLLARLEYDFTDNVSISNQTRWARVDRQARYTLPTGFNVLAGGTTCPGEVCTQTQFYDRTNTTLTNQTNLALQFATGAFQHNVATGIELSREKSEALRFGTVNPGATDVFNPDPDRAGAAPLAPTQTNEIEVDTVALYAYDTIEFSKQWEATGGLRLEHYTVDISSLTIAGASTGAADGFETSETTLGGKIGLVYKPVETGSIYASFGISNQPPGSYLSNPDISRTGDNAFPGFVAGADPIESHNYEIGTKWDFFAGRLSTTAAVFHTEKKNVPIVGIDPTLPAGPGNPSNLKGYGEQIVNGIEIGVAGKILPEWNVYGGLLLMDSERKHSAYLDSVLLATTPGDYGFATTTDGDELSFTPNVSANLWTTYRFPIGLTVGGGVQYVGSSYLGRPDDAARVIPNGTYGKLPSYTIFNAMTAYEVTPNIDVRLNIDNITDEDYAVASNWNGNRVTLGTPRTFIVSTGFKF